MTGGQLPLGFDADADDQARCSCGWVGSADLAEAHLCGLPEPGDADQDECEICVEARQDSHIEILAHLVLAAGPVHVLIWRPDGWSTTFGREGGIVVAGGIDEVPMSPPEAEQVARALLEAADRADR